MAPTTEPHRPKRTAMRPARVLLSPSFFVLIFAILLGTSACLAAESAGDAPTNPDAQLELGLDAYRTGRFESAAQAWQAAADAYGTRGDHQAQIDALLRRASALQALGAYPDALLTLNGAFALAKDSSDKTTRSLVDGAIGGLLVLAGKLDRAEQLLVPAANASTTIGQPQLAPVLQQLGNLRIAQDRPEEARQAYVDAYRLAEQPGGDPGVAAEARVGAARGLEASGNPGAAEAEVDQVLVRMRQSDPSHTKAYTALAAGRLLQDMAKNLPAGDRARLNRKAHEAYRLALEVANEIDDPNAIAYAFGYAGGLDESEGNYFSALKLTRRAVFTAQEAQQPQSLYLWQWQLGRLLAAQGRTDDAIDAYRQAVYNLQSIRYDMVNSGGGRSVFREQVGPVYFGLADLVLRKAASTSDAADKEKLLLSARDIIEQLKAAELQDYFQDQCVAESQGRITALDELAPDTAVIYPVLLPDRTELLVSLPSGMRQFVIPVDSETLTREIRQFRLLLEKRTTGQFMPHGRQLYDWLIRPIEPSLRDAGISTLVFVPDGPLRTIPMAPLHDGESFLIERYAIATTPGLTLTDPKVIHVEEVRLLLNALTESVQGFPPLPNADREAEAVANLLAGRTLKDRDFLVHNLEQELKEQPYTVVHIASHGQFQSDVRETFLLTYDDKLSMDELEKFMRLSQFREEPVELLTLSACQSAAGDDRAALGLAGVAIKAGARSALATLWFINDQASSDLVAAFYRELNKPGTSKAQALQRAQKELMADLRYRHPGYWGPFLLIGNWL